MDTIAQRLATTYPDTNANLGIQVVALKEKVVGAISPTLLLLFATLLFVLLIACADITNLSLTRAVARQKEISLRLAIGATRGQVIRQLLVENVCLAILGSLAGVALAHAGLRVLNTLLPTASLPRQQEITIDVAVFGFTLLSSLAVGVISGLVPALQASRVDLFMPELDQCFSALLTDLEQRGMLDTTLIVMTGEFGRTAEINVNNGRDHWPNCFSLVVAGAGVPKRTSHRSIRCRQHVRKGPANRSAGPDGNNLQKAWRGLHQGVHIQHRKANEDLRRQAAVVLGLSVNKSIG
jgi:hypothetical protein